MTTKLDIEGIRESIGHICAHIHHLTEAELQDNLRWLTARTQNLLTEVDRLRGELETASKVINCEWDIVGVLKQTIPAIPKHGNLTIIAVAENAIKHHAELLLTLPEQDNGN